MGVLDRAGKVDINVVRNNSVITIPTNELLSEKNIFGDVRGNIIDLWASTKNFPPVKVICPLVAPV